MKKRVVVLGAAGFVGSSIIKALQPKNYEIVALSRKEVDFTHPLSRVIIEERVQDGDIVICAAAKAPAKNMDMLTENISMITNIAEALKDRHLSYVLNISSDAVYADSADNITESSTIEPLSAHGIMHCMREYILQYRINAPMGHLRPTLIFGEGDPHNGYGPNSFIRNAIAGKNLEIFGNGEERRDHIFVEDVAALAVAMIEQKTNHAINAVTGQVISFLEIAEFITKAAKQPVEIIRKPRSGPMPHNGYRAFSNAAAQALCPTLAFKTMAEYIAERMGGSSAIQSTRSA
jgi:UDP-glucose 4-epimerase